MWPWEDIELHWDMFPHFIANNACKQHLCTNRNPLIYVAAAAKSLQLCPALCDPTDGSPPGSSVPGILQARILEWVTISFSTDTCSVSSVQLLSRSVVSDSVWPHRWEPTRLLCPWDSLGTQQEIKNFPDRQKFREFSTTKPTFQQMLKELH